MADAGDNPRRRVCNLYCHFPFCRRKCSYCALHSRAGSAEETRRAHVAGLVADARRAADGGLIVPHGLETVYFGGGSPALCDLAPLFAALAPYRAPDAEFTVELHPLDVTDDLLAALADGGVNRVSMGVQALDDATLADMGRGYAVADAERAFARIRRRFDNAGIDLIVGYPGEPTDWDARVKRLADWGLRHCSVYSLILEEKTVLARRVARGDAVPPGDDATLDRLATVAAGLAALGLARYEISNYAAPGFECRHNLSVWRGEDYLGFGEGAHGRVGLRRTHVVAGGRVESETLDAVRDALERRIFRLRTREGLDAAGRADWVPKLDDFVRRGLLTRAGEVYTLTPRGTEVCDAVLAELV